MLPFRAVWCGRLIQMTCLRHEIMGQDQACRRSCGGITHKPAEDLPASRHRDLLLRANHLFCCASIARHDEQCDGTPSIQAAPIRLPCGQLARVRHGPESDPNSAVQRIDAMCREGIWRRIIAQSENQRAAAWRRLQPRPPSDLPECLGKKSRRIRDRFSLTQRIPAIRLRLLLPSPCAGKCL